MYIEPEQAFYCRQTRATNARTTPKGNVSMTAKTTAKDRATSTPRASEPAPAKPTAKTSANTPAPKSRLRFLPGQCHFRNEAGKAACQRPRPAEKPSHRLCDVHEALWHAGKLRLSPAGNVSSSCASRPRSSTQRSSPPRRPRSRSPSRRRARAPLTSRRSHPRTPSRRSPSQRSRRSSDLDSTEARRVASTGLVLCWPAAVVWRKSPRP